MRAATTSPRAMARIFVRWSTRKCAPLWNEALSASGK